MIMEWISVIGNNLPDKPNDNIWKRYIVSCVLTYKDYIFELPEEKEIVTTALYDHEQKIWHLDNDMRINALRYDTGEPLCGDYVTHWMPLPEPPKERE